MPYADAGETGYSSPGLRFILFTARGLGPELKEDLAVVGDVGDVLAECLE